MAATVFFAYVKAIESGDSTPGTPPAHSMLPSAWMSSPKSISSTFGVSWIAVVDVVNDGCVWYPGAIIAFTGTVDEYVTRAVVGVTTVAAVMWVRQKKKKKSKLS